MTLEEELRECMGELFSAADAVNGMDEMTLEEELRECMREMVSAAENLKKDIAANGMDDETRSVLAELRPQIEDLMTWLKERK